MSFSGLDLNIFEQLFKDNYEELYYRTYRYVGSKEETELLVQDAFVELWEKRRDHEAEEEVKAYVYKLIHRRATDYMKARLGEGSEDTPADEPDTSSDEPEEEEEKDFSTLLLEGIARLPDGPRRILRLCRQSDLTYGEIAGELDISREAVRQQARAAIQKLRAFIDK